MRLLPPPFQERLEARMRCPDPTVRVLTEAQVEIAASLVQRKSQWQTADTVTLRSHNFPASNALTAVNATTELTLANAPAGNNLYTVHFNVHITPVVPGTGTNDHELIVAIETDTLGTGTWVERAQIIYQLARKVGETATITVPWRPFESEGVRVAGLTSASKIRLKIKSFTAPVGATVSVHGFDGVNDPITGGTQAGVTYHTGPALDFLDDGVTLASNIQTKVSHAASDGFETDMGGPPTEQGASPFIVARIVWGADDPADLVIDRILARLDPDRDGIPGNKNVAYWICQPWALRRILDSDFGATEHLADLVPLAESVRVPAGAGTSAADVSFSWGKRTFYLDGRGQRADMRPRPKSVRPNFTDPDGSNAVESEYDSSPTTFVFIWAIQVDPVTNVASPATNVGWARDSAVNESTNGSRKLRAVQAAIRAYDRRWVLEGPATQGATPRPVFRMRVETGSFANEKLQLSGAGNRIDLGATPTNDVEFSGEAEVPLGATAIFEVLKDGGVAATDADWRAYTDGQVVGDIADVTKRQTYELRCRMTTNAGGDVTPILRALGVREITKVPLWDVVDFKACRWAVDPVELVPRIPEATFVAIKDGDNDARDRMTELLSDNDRGDILLRTWMGDPSRPRAEWVHLDDFFVEDWDPDGASIPVTGVSPLVLLKGALPKYDTVTETRQPKTYANQTPKQAAADLIGSQIGLPGRYRGPEIEDESILLTHTITDSEAKDELDAVAYLARGAWTSEAGRIRFVNLLDPGAVRHIFDPNEIEPLSVGPGFRQALHEFFSKYNWDETENRYRGEVLSTPAITPESFGGTGFKGISRLDAPQTLRDSVCRWIPTEQIAKDAGRLRIEGLSTGLRVWRFRASYSYPELRIGDRVSVPTDRFLLHDPVANRALRGALYGTGPIVEVGDPEHREFGVWIRTLADIVGAGEVGTRQGDGKPIALGVGLSVADSGVVSSVIRARGALSVKVATSTSAFPSAATVRAAAAQALDGLGTLTTASLATLTDGQTLYVSVFAYEAAAGAGAESLLAQAQIAFRYLPTVSILSATPVWRANRLTIQVYGNTGVASFKVATSTSAFPAAGTGTVVGGQDGLFDAGTAFVYGDTVYVTITPYPQAAGAGTAGPAFRFRARLISKEGVWDETTGKPLRTQDYSDGKYALKASDTVGKETDDDLFISSTKTVKIGTVASPSSITKTIRIPFGELVGTSGASDYGMVQGYVRPGTANTAVELVASVVLPKGVTITTFRARMYRQTVNDAASAVFSRVDESTGNLTLLKSLVHSTTGWATLSDSVTETVSDTTYRVLTSLNGVSNALDARFMWFEFDYTMPDYSKGY